VPAHQASRHNHPRRPQEPPLHDHTHQTEDIFSRASSADKASDPGIVDQEAISVDTDGTGEVQCACMVGQKNSCTFDVDLTPCACARVARSRVCARSESSGHQGGGHAHVMLQQADMPVEGDCIKCGRIQKKAPGHSGGEVQGEPLPLSDLVRTKCISSTKIVLNNAGQAGILRICVWMRTASTMDMRRPGRQSSLSTCGTWTQKKGLFRTQ
jgi:hypothetical protein